MSTVCSDCQQEIEIGDFPFCPHGSIFNQDARRFNPIIIHRDVATGEYSFPAHNADPVPSGHEKIEITNIRQADRHTRLMNERERSKLSDQRENNRLYFEEKTKDRRETVDRLLASGKLSPRARMLADMARKYTDAKRDKKNAHRIDPQGRFQVFAMDSSNRMPYASKETDYKQRRS